MLIDQADIAAANKVVRDLAAAAGVSAPFISEIESGKKDGSVSVMKKIADVRKVDLDDLV